MVMRLITFDIHIGTYIGTCNRRRHQHVPALISQYNILLLYIINIFISRVLTAQRNSIFKYMSRPHAVHCRGARDHAHGFDWARPGVARETDWLAGRRRRRTENWVSSSSPHIPLRLAYSDGGGGGGEVSE